MLIRLLANPFGSLTLSPSTSAPASCHRLIAAGLFTKLTPTSSSIASALLSIISNASSFKTLNNGMLRSIYLAVSKFTDVRSALRAAPPPRERLFTALESDIN